MWFLFLEILVLITVSFFAGAGVTALSLRMLLPGSDNEVPAEPDGATS